MIYEKISCRKGWFYSLDAMLAVILMATLLISAFTILGKMQGNQGGHSLMHNFCMDSLAVLEKRGDLRNAIITGDASTLQTYVDVMPDQICVNMTLMNENRVVRNSLTRNGCGAEDDDYVVDAKRTFIVDGRGYIAEMKAWYR